MRGLKTLVIVLGMLLVGGMAALVATIAWRASRSGTPAVATARTGAAPARPYEAALDLPPGGEIVSLEAAGDRLILMVGLPDGSRRLIILDMGSGARLGTIELRPGGA